MRKISAFVMASTLAGTIPPVHAAETVTYSYDYLGRLTKVARSGGPASGATVELTHDATANRTRLVSVKGQPSGGGGCRFTPRGEAFTYDWEAPSNPLMMWVDILGSCSSPTTIQYSFSDQSSPSGTFVVSPSQQSYYLYQMPTPCASQPSRTIQANLTIVSGPGSLASGVANITIDCSPS